MDTPPDIISSWVKPIHFLYGVVAVCGGIARYLNSYVRGSKFSFRVFVASAFISGFSGYMFALLGISLNMSDGMTYMMAGTGGFFGDQTMKLILEYLQVKSKGE